jgi:hypothetical protein
VTALEAAVVGEILAVAGQQLELRGPPPGPGEPLAGRLDSLQLLTLVVAVEDRFQLVITDDDAARATTLEEVARLVIERASPSRLPPPLAEGSR